MPWFSGGGEDEGDGKFRAIVEAAPDALVIVDEHGTIVLVNRQAEVSFGYARDEMLGQPIETLLPAPYRDRHTRHRARFFSGPTSRPMGAGLDLAGQRKDGSQFPVDVSLSPIPTSRGLVISAAIRDITERRRNERMFELLRQVAIAANGAVSVDDAFRSCLAQICSYSALPVGHVYQVESDQLLVPTSLWHLPSASVWGPLRDVSMRSVLQADDSFLGTVLTTRRAIWLAVGDPSVPMVRPLGKLGVRTACAIPVLVGSEVTHVIELFSPKLEPEDPALLDLQLGTVIGRVVERARAQDQRVYAEALERTNRELTLFAYVASHDLREPLRMITSFLGLLSDRYADKLDERAQRYIGHAMDGATRMTDLLKSLLEYSRLDRGEPFGAASCQGAVDKALSNLHELIRESGAEVSCREPLPVVLGDETQLVQLFQNLIGNAMKFRAADRPPRIELLARPRGQSWELVVQDNGIGLDMTHADRIFEIFERLHTTEEYAGTGMGLAICKRVVERHGGRIWLESEPGVGSSFHFLIPAFHQGEADELQPST